MHIKSLSLRHFRTYNRLELDLPVAPVLLIGANAQGKTSLLEAIAYLAMGRSPLTNVEQHLIHWNALEAGMPFAHLKTDIARHNTLEQIEIAIQCKQLNNGNTRLEKKIKIDQHPARRSDLAGHLNVVIFLPEDVGLVSGAPANRRRHLDDVLSQIYPDYVESLHKYQIALSRRNALLKHLRERGGDIAQLAPLEEILTETGVSISLYRRRLVSALSLHTDRFHQELTGGTAWLHLHYQPDFDPLSPPELNYQIGLLPESIQDIPVDVRQLQDAYRALLQRQRREAIQRGVTLIGPHRDEVRFISNGIDLGTYGSRGQQRTAVLALRLAELRWLEQETGEIPVLLLDEVLAELDRARRTHFLKLLGHVEQAIMATTDADMFPETFREHILKLEVVGGIIRPVEHES
ncbi:MAG: DNA replication/repair protein RecF [Anaerolineae bacterium]|nr:DNA replication/repair protein RecF [Anaerolineae bacterium]